MNYFYIFYSDTYQHCEEHVVSIAEEADHVRFYGRCDLPTIQQNIRCESARGGSVQRHSIAILWYVIFSRGASHITHSTVHIAYIAFI